MIDKTISHYKIVEKLGEGGMGIVYKAQDLKLDRYVALKFLPSYLHTSAEEKQRFIHEAKASSALDHNNICTIHEIDETEDEQLFISMAYYEGKTLDKRIKEKPLSVDDAINIAIQIAQGLTKAHEKEIVHRDIKPANIMLTNDGVVKILDFGLAKLSTQTKLTKDGSTIGTIAYMSPEQAKGDEVDFRTDIWSFGVVLYEMVTGQLPFKGDYDQAVIYAILNEEPASISDSKEQLNRSLEALVTKTLEKNPDERYQSMVEIRSELEKIKTNLVKNSSQVKSMNMEEKPSLAVLPFVNMSADPENEYFSDGLTEELINALTSLKDYRVVARTSAFAFKGKQSDIRDIGIQLNVQHVLEGSVRKFGNRIRITAQLITIEDGYHLWSEKYDRDLEDVFAVQDEIASVIAKKLQSEFTQARSLSQKENRPDISAYELYLKGRYCINKFSPDWLLKAQTFFSEAIDLDPQFAPAYAGLAFTFVILTNPTGLLDGREALPKARTAAEKALKLDPNLAEAYAVLGAVATFLDWDSDKARQSFEKAIELNPDNVDIRQWYELALSLLEQSFDEALAHMNYALEIDPLNLLILVRTGYLYAYKYDYDRSIEYFKKIISIEPEILLGHSGLADVYSFQGKYDLAFAEGEKARQLSGGGPSYLAILGLNYARGGKTKEAEDILTDLLRRYKTEPISPFWIGIIYMGLEKFDEMYTWYNRAFEERDSNLLYTFAPLFDPIREDSRFKVLRKKMGFKA
jgi:serine/threonine protein kinase/cytochrome c-type biogenesis protein CcmH/NrfG